MQLARASTRCLRVADEQQATAEKATRVQFNGAAQQGPPKVLKPAHSIVDTNKTVRNFGVSGLLGAGVGLASRRKRNGQFSALPPSGWEGASKLVRSVGDTVISVAVSDDDALLAVGSTNKKAIVYSTSTGAELASFTAKAGINAVVFSGVAAATRLLAGTFGGQVQMWSVASERQARRRAAVAVGRPPSRHHQHLDRRPPSSPLARSGGRAQVRQRRRGPGDGGGRWRPNPRGGRQVVARGRV